MSTRRYFVRVWLVAGHVDYIIGGYSRVSAINGGWRKHPRATKVEAFLVPKGY